MKTIVVSAVNLKIGGTLTILRDCLQHLSVLSASGEYRVVALVYGKQLAYYPNIEYIELCWPKRNWFNRLWCEYVFMHKISVRLSPVYLWLSLHDTTPRVRAERRAVYCHNSFPFYHWKVSEWLFAPKIVLFSLFSKYIYRINIHRNTYIIVQQRWFREAFVRWFGLKEETVIVAPPSVSGTCGDVSRFSCAACGEKQHPSRSRSYAFIYAAAPDSHKNFECICRAAKILQQRSPELDYKIYLTMKGNENRYARWLHFRWGRHLPSLKFVGYLDKKRLNGYYRQCDCLIFPSKVETWGLPISEFASFQKPMLLADLPYAHETSEGCSQVAFFHPDKPEELAVQMEKLLRGTTGFLSGVAKTEIRPPVAGSWKELFYTLLK